jgi:hypothetical protein
MATTTKVCVGVAGTGSATLPTAVTNFNTAMAAAVTAAGAVTGVVKDSIQPAMRGLIFDATNYIMDGSVTYITVT